MRLPFQLARRYLFGKKSTNAINLISGISIFGLTIGTAALIIILSVFNGFESLLSGVFNAFNPDIEVTPKVGKAMPVDTLFLQSLAEQDGVIDYSVCIEDLALFQYEDIQEIGKLKGVDKHYTSVTSLDTCLLYGNFQYERSGVQKGIIGTGLRNKLGMQINQSLNPLTVFTILKKPRAGREFNKQAMYPAGVFSVQSDVDYEYMIGSYAMASRLFEKPNQFTSIEVKLSEGVDENKITEQLRQAYPEYVFKTRYEQDEAFLKILNIEKWIAFLIVSLTMILIAFNLVGSLWMIILEKKKDFSVLKAMGFTKQQIFNTVLLKGMLMCCLGIGFGFLIALGFTAIQKSMGVISIPDSFMIPNYPIQLRIGDFVIVLFTVLFVGFLGSLLPARRASQITANVNSF